MLAYAGRAGDAREKLKEIIQVLGFYHSVYLLYWYTVQILTHLWGRWLRTRRLPQVRQYLYCCTSKASKLSTCITPSAALAFVLLHRLPQLRQYLYFCTNKASKVSTGIMQSQLDGGDVTPADFLSSVLPLILLAFF